MEVVPPHVLAIGSLVPVQKSSPERRNQKEIVAGEERPKFLTIKQTEDAQGGCSTLSIHHGNRSHFIFLDTLKDVFQRSLLMQKSATQTFLFTLFKLLCDVLLDFVFAISLTSLFR